MAVMIDVLRNAGYPEPGILADSIYNSAVSMHVSPMELLDLKIKMERRVP